MKKFLFDNNDFDEKSLALKKQLFTEEQLTLAREQSYAEGRNDGFKEARGMQEEHIALALDRLCTLAAQLSAAEETRESQSLSATARLVMRITHKILPAFAAKLSLVDIENAVLQVLESRKDEPRIALTVESQHLDALRTRIDAITREKSYAGKIILMADDTLGPADCKIEWADGGSERILDRLIHQIEAEFTKAVDGLETSTEKQK